MANRITGGRISLIIQNIPVTVPIGLYFGHKTGVCHYCKRRTGHVIRCYAEFGEREADAGYLHTQGSLKTSAGLQLIAEAFLDGKAVCGECYNRWQDNGHARLRENLHTDWVSITYEKGNSGMALSPQGAMAEVRQEIYDAGTPDGAIVLSVHEFDNECVGNVWLRDTTGYTRLLPERILDEVEGRTVPHNLKYILRGEMNRYAVANQENGEDLRIALTLRGLSMRIDRLP